jgi:nicotinic acid mononucleotide adenylyltransferase
LLDLAVRCGFHNRNGNRPMKFVGVCRPGFGEQLRTEWKEYTEANPVHPLPQQGECVEAPPVSERHFILVESETEDFSSTAVRDSIINGQYDEMEKMLHPGVAEYIRNKNYFNYAEITKSLLK